MPSPSKLALFSGLATTAAIFVGGACLASGMTPTDAAEPSPSENIETSPLVAPMPASAAPTVPEAAPPAERMPNSLHVTLTGARNASGKIIVLVFENAAAFSAYDHEQAVGYAELDASTAPMTYSFEDLVEGPYAVAIIHDENGNYDLDMAEGYPVEGYGTSHASSPYDQLNFEQASVAPTAITVRLHYLE